MSLTGIPLLDVALTIIIVLAVIYALLIFVKKL